MAKKILTKEGLEKLEKELKDLKTKQRQEIADRIQKAKELGDLSENAEYSEAKEQQALNETRIAEIEDTIKNSEIVEGKASSGNTVTIGSTIVVSTSGKERTFIIVGSNEADPAEGKISNESPLAISFLGKKKGQKVEVTTPRGKTEYEIKDIK